MRDVRRYLPEDSLDALAALVRILGSPSSSRDLFGTRPRPRTARRLKMKRRRAPRARPARES
ncbi:MAG TPA: hypothetical protein VHA55_14030 [Pseudorhodoplanes sp.]|jgi:hypothetical protein|nr:hypothetical protein [Pseudorhodoplanes sp.]